jgi:hypothetical protein
VAIAELDTEAVRVDSKQFWVFSLKRSNVSDFFLEIEHASGNKIIRWKLVPAGDYHDGYYSLYQERDPIELVKILETPRNLFVSSEEGWALDSEAVSKALNEVKNKLIATNEGPDKPSRFIERDPPVQTKK